MTDGDNSNQPATAVTWVEREPSDAPPPDLSSEFGLLDRYLIEQELGRQNARGREKDGVALEYPLNRGVALLRA